MCYLLHDHHQKSTQVPITIRIHETQNEQIDNKNHPKRENPYYATRLDYAATESSQEVTLKKQQPSLTCISVCLYCGGFEVVVVVVVVVVESCT